MLQDEQERELDRKFTRIESWNEFLARWRSIDTEQEAIGFLYAGVAVPTTKSTWSAEEAKVIHERVQFYLQWASHKNEKVRTTAQQLLMKHWLKKTEPTAEFLEVHHTFLTFLIELAKAQVEITKEPYSPRAPLLQPPYPRFVAEYLLKMYEVWHHEYRQERDHKAFQSLTEPLVTALCFWGLSYVLAKDGNGKPAIPVIERFLANRDYEPGKVFFKLSGYGEPLADLSFVGAQEKVNERAALALLKMRYWFGDGVHEQFDGAARLKHILEK